IGIVLIYQGCSKKASSFNYDPNLDKSGKYGLGAGGGGYACVPGKRLGIWLDPDNSGNFKDENKLGFIVSYSGALTAAANYNYYSASAHPHVGPVPIGFKTNVFFYEGPDGLAISMFSNIDEAGSADNQVDIDIETLGNANSDKVLLSDDGGELKFISASGSGVRLYQGRFHYWTNTDGGVIGPFYGENFKIRVKFLSTGDIQDARFYSANGYSFNLKDSENQISSFMIAYEDYEDCK
ncbi:MAG: hypothetical protein IT287_04150, partial [Bdellovibrionaceae bacterium]|nr:hypothetical protein [Pseudobdellovibrionaceae bacterium]